MTPDGLIKSNEASQKACGPCNGVWNLRYSPSQVCKTKAIVTKIPNTSSVGTRTMPALIACAKDIFKHPK